MTDCILGHVAFEQGDRFCSFLSQYFLFKKIYISSIFFLLHPDQLIYKVAFDLFFLCDKLSHTWQP